MSCSFCGYFRVTATDAAAIVRDIEIHDVRPYLAAHIRQGNRRGEKPVVVSVADWKEKAEGHHHTPVPRKLAKLLEYLGKQSEFPGEQVKIETNDYPVCDARNRHELRYLVETLQQQGDVEFHPADDMATVTANGWAKLEPVGGVPHACFVAMAFDPRMTSALDDGILPAIEACGFDAHRVDRVQHNESINDRIVAGLRAAQFVVADVTFQRNGVYFEGGFAMGLGRPVIWTVQESDKGNVHFDTSHLNHIVWTDPADLREKLTLRIRATIPGAKME
jgi:hypothetical protein